MMLGRSLPVHRAASRCLRRSSCPPHIAASTPPPQASVSVQMYNFTGMKIPPRFGLWKAFRSIWCSYLGFQTPDSHPRSLGKLLVWGLHHIITAHIESALFQKRRFTITAFIFSSSFKAMSNGPLLRSSPLCSAQGKNLKRADAATGPARGLPPLAGQRQHAARPHCCGVKICRFLITGCAVDLNHYFLPRALASRPREPYQISCPVALPGWLRAWTRDDHLSSFVSERASKTMARKSAQALSPS